MSDSAIRWIMFFINPFIAMIFSFKEYKMPYAKNLFWAFCTFYGLTFTIGEESLGSDINRYVSELSQLYQQPFLSIQGAIEYFRYSGEIDILSTIISYTLSRFTESQAILTMVYAFIFGYFFSRNIWYVFGLLKNKITFLSKIVLLTLILVMPIWQIGGFRMWTAFHIFMFGLLPYIFENKKSKLIFLYSSILVHFSFMIPISIFILYRLLGNRINLYFIIFIITLLISEINIGSLNSFINNFLPDIIIERTSSYLIDAQIEGIQSVTLNWYAVWKTKALSWGLTIILFYLFFYGRKLIELKPKFKRLFSITLLMYATANILMHIPSGGRFLNIAFFLALIMIIIYLDQFYHDFNFKQLIKYLAPVFFLFIIVTIRRGFYATSITSVLGNPIIAIVSIGNNMSLNDLIKWVL